MSQQKISSDLSVPNANGNLHKLAIAYILYIYIVNLVKQYSVRSDALCVCISVFIALCPSKKNPTNLFGFFPTALDQMSG